MIAAIKAASGGGAGLQRWIIGGASGALSTSDDSIPSTWTSRTSGFGTDQINSIASDGSTFVAVGAAGKMTTSTDAITWTARTSSFGTTVIRSVAWGAGTWVAVGEGGKIATATNPTGTWTQRTSGTTDNFQGIAYGNGIWVAVGRTSAGAHFIRTATDPTATWTSRTSPLAAVNASATNNVAWCPTQAVFITGLNGSATPNAATSTDGLTWTGRNLATTPNAAFGLAFVSNASVIVAGFSLVTTSDIDSSSDSGASWTARTPATTQPLYGGATSPSGLMITAHHNATGPVFALQSSTDGTTWTSRTAPSVGEPRAVCHTEGFR